MSAQPAENDAPCVYEDVEQERPSLILPGHTGHAIGGGIPSKRWCWTHARWTPISPAKTGGAS